MVLSITSRWTRLLAVAAACAPAAAWAAEAISVDELLARQERTRSEYSRLSREVALSQERLDSLASEVASVRKDHASLTAALIQAAKTEKKLAIDVEDISQRLEGMKAQEADLARALHARRDVLAEVLGALQRMGLDPPPALLVTPRDALSSVRSAILLGAVVPELRAETELLLADLSEQRRLVASIAAERDSLAAAIAAQRAEKRRLDLLLAEKKELRDRSATALAQERGRAEALAARAESMKSLIEALEKQTAAAVSAEERAKREAEARERRRATLAAMPIPEANRLAEALPFAELRGRLALPAAGRFVRRFGGGDGDGGVMLGDMLATQSGAIVTAPADGTVLYAGPFRSYGQLLILNAGDGYHVVLAGMGQINVSLGQSVLAGEPIAAMGEAKVASAAAFATEDAEPELYVEFRKDGKPVDPSPWWSERLSGRTGNGT